MAYPQDKQVSSQAETGFEGETEKEECAMGDLAGLLALMQNNKGMDLPGLLALCKEKGYHNGFGGEGMFMFVFLILFLFAGGGWNGLNGRQQGDLAAIAGSNLQEIVGIHDRISAAQAASSQGFLQLDTKLCSAIAETIAAVRNQGDRNYDATRNVGEAVRECCCVMQSKLAELGCKVDGLYGAVSLAQERTVNAMEKGFCKTDTDIEKLRAEMNLGFERTQCLIQKTAADTESARKDREIENLRDLVRETKIATQLKNSLEGFALANYTPNRSTGGTGGAAS